MSVPLRWFRLAMLVALLIANGTMSLLARSEGFVTNADATIDANQVRMNAVSVACGQTITTDTRLDADLSCPPETEIGIIIGASNITLDLGGHMLSGYAPVGKVNRGIVADNVSGVTIKNGTVAEFSEGVDVFNSQGFTVENLTIRNLRNTDPDYFISGISIANSNAVVVRDSQFEFTPLTFHKEAVDVYASDVNVSNIVVHGGGVGVNFSFANTCDPEHSPNTGQILNSRFVDSRHGVLVACSSGARIAGNDFDCPSGPGWCEGIRSYGPFAGAMTGLRAEGNTVRNAFSGFNWEGVAQSSATDNTITASTGWGIALRQTQGEDGAPIYPPTGNTISNNRVWGNNIDLYDDETGKGNTWVRNVCATKQGAGIPECSALTVITNPSDQSVVAGQTASFSAAATYAGWQPNFTPAVQWQVSMDAGSTWADVSEATSPTLGFNATIADSGKQFRAVFTNSDGNGTSTTTAATLTVEAISSGPTVMTHPSNQTVSDGHMATFSAIARGTPTPTVQWQVSTNGGMTWVDLVTMATLPTYSFITAITDNGMQYRAVSLNNQGAATTSAATLTVGPSTLTWETGTPMQLCVSQLSLKRTTLHITCIIHKTLFS